MENHLNRFVAQYFGNNRSSLHSVPGTGKSLKINGGDKSKTSGMNVAVTIGRVFSGQVRPFVRLNWGATMVGGMNL